MYHQLQSLLAAHTNSTASDLQQVFTVPVMSFKNDLFPLLSDLDSGIPGIGMQYAVWSKTTPHYPFSKEFDAIVRPLRYVPYFLAAGIPFEMVTRSIAKDAGGHLESCVKELGRTHLDVRWSCYVRKPLGALVKVKPIRLRIGEPLATAITEFSQISWNQAKHQYSDGSPTSVISVEDAIGSYFVARALGAEVLKKAGRLEPLVDAINEARQLRRLYVTGELPSVRDSEVPWMIRDISLPDQHQTKINP